MPASDCSPSLHRSGPIVDMSRSPHAALRPVPLAAVQLHDTFWAPRLAVNRQVTLPAQLQQCEETGRIDNFRRASGQKPDLDFQGIFFNDSDVYKWIEATAYTLATHPDPKLDAVLDAVIDAIAAAQEPDGYLNTYFTLERRSERFTNLKDMHEIYCAGHLIQAAVAHHRATGKRALLDVAYRLADCLDNTFGPEPGKRPGACGHEEAEMALVELCRETGEARYLNLARFMIEQRGQKPGIFGNSAYFQDHLPFVEQTEFTGHAVRHLYLACGAADVCAETDVPGYRTALESLWRNLTAKRMYVTGGAGSRYEGEAFGSDYELPNDRAYTETCAAIGSVMWNWRMLNLTGETRYADLMELTLYNAVLSGLSLDGAHYFYQNPLADRGQHRRQAWFGCACCPPNIARMLASLPGCFYSTSEQGVYVHLYATGTATLPLANGETISLVQKTRYPWDGEIEILIESAPTMPFHLHLRIPGWHPAFHPDSRLEINGEPMILGGVHEAHSVAQARGQYVQLERKWEAGDVIRLNLPMPVERIVSHPHVLGNWGRVALRRGPLVYCLEQADHPDADVWDILLHAYVELTPEFVPDLLGGVIVLKGRSVAIDSDGWDELLYSPQETAITADTRPVDITAIPYYAWANRQAGPMQVWLPTQPPDSIA
jgi:DUF1680 family protein